MEWIGNETVRGDGIAWMQEFEKFFLSGVPRVQARIDL
jgi:hypothetical protein